MSVYNSGKGFIIKIHDQLGFKFRCSHYNGDIFQPLLSVTHDYYPGAGTVNSDILCMDATDTKIVVAGYNSQKVSRDQSVIRDGQSVPGLGVQY